MQQNEAPLSSDYDTTISLLNVYFSEWSHRDQILWSQIFRFYFATLIITLLPNIYNYFQMELPPLPDWGFRIIGIILSFVFLYISLGYAVRLHNISESYRFLLDKLPDGYKQVPLHSMNYKGIPIGKIFKPRLGYLICIILFFSLLLLSLLLITF